MKNTSEKKLKVLNILLNYHIEYPEQDKSMLENVNIFNNTQIQ